MCHVWSSYNRHIDEILISPVICWACFTSLLFRLLKSTFSQTDNYFQFIFSMKALWDKTLEFRFLLQKVFSTSNKLPQVCCCLEAYITLLLSRELAWCFSVSCFGMFSAFDIVWWLFQESIRSSFCIPGTEVDQAYSDLISSSKQTLNCMLELQEVWVVHMIISIIFSCLFNLMKYMILPCPSVSCLDILFLFTFSGFAWE